MTLRVTRTGRAIARTGLEPESVDDLLAYFAAQKAGLLQLLDRTTPGTFVQEDDFEFVVLHALYSSDEYQGEASFRYLPYQMLAEPLTGPQIKLQPYLYPSQNVAAINAAIYAYRWIQGTDIRVLESTLDIRSGVLNALFGETASLLRGFADILYAASSRRTDNVSPAALDSVAGVDLAVFVGPLRSLAKRLIGGLPEEMLWMCDLEKAGARLLSRNEIVAFRDQGLTTPDAVLDGGQKNLVLAALSTISSQNQSKANDVVASAHSFKSQARERLKARQIARLPECESLILKTYTATGTDFEACIDEIWNCLSFNIEDRDDNTKNAFPDFIIAHAPARNWAVECKSKTNSNYVDFNDATDVIRKANTNGYRDAFKITICQPFVATDVPRKLGNCDELCIVNTDDLIEGAIRVKRSQLSQDGFIDWLSRPGQALCEFLVTGD